MGAFAVPWELLGEPWGVLWGVFAAPWRPFRNHLVTRCWHFLAPPLRCTGVEFESFWEFLGDVSLHAFGAPLDLLGDACGSFAISLGRLASSWPPFGRPLAPLWAHFAPCLLFATTWTHLASFLMPLGCNLGPKGAPFHVAG